MPRFILLLSAHLESGHYFNPHAQRIIDGKMAGAKLAVMDPRLSNTASMADYWMPTYPGTEAAVLLAMAKVILDENRFDATFVKNWTNWEELEVDGFRAKGQSFRALIEALQKHYAKFTPQFAEKESGVQGGRHRQNRARNRRLPAAVSPRICGAAALPEIWADGSRRGP